MLAGPLHAGRQAKQIALIDPAGRDDRQRVEASLGQGPRLIDHERIDLLQQFQNFGVLDQHAGLSRRGRRRP